MEVAPNFHLTRTHTAPLNGRMNNFSPSQPALGMPSPGHQGANIPSHYSNFSTSSFSTLSRSSNATPVTPSSTPAYPPQQAPSVLPMPLQATDNVLNTRAGQESSLFQICLNLRRRLMNVPGFHESLQEVVESADEDTDPVTLLWRTFRRGYPLMTIYNASNPAEPLEIDETKVRKVENRPRAATAKFLTAVMKQMKVPSEDCFMISDLYSDDTTGFVKVTKLVNRVLDILEQQGYISANLDEGPSSGPAANTKRSHREHIIDELVRTERTYVQHLELLQAFKKLVEEKGIIPGDAIHDIFLNLNALLDFQRRFLIRVEQTNAQPEPEQNWGQLFILYKDAFKVYEPFIANQKRCEDVAMQNFEKLKETGGPPELRQMVESPTVLSSFLLKPFQRLAKYPLLLKELKEKGGLDDMRRTAVADGIEAASSVLQRTNAAVDREERNEAVEELKGRVEDWKGHKMDAFGDLLLHGTFTVLKGEMVAAKNSEREYKIYLFEMILLCCKEIDISKNKNKGRKNDSSGKPKLQLKGRIFMQNVTDTLVMQKPGSYTCQIFWKGDPGIENFIVRFPTEELMKKWAGQVDYQRRIWKDPAFSNRASGRQTSTSTTEFVSLQGSALVNPYAQEYENEDDDDDAAATAASQYAYRAGPNGSNPSLRSRAGTGDSIFPSNAARVPPPRFPMPEDQPPQLRQLHTSGGAMSPQERQIDSYFSPTSESPISTRTSSSSTGMFTGNRLPAMTNGWHPSEDHARYTAPAMGRSTPQARGPQRPSLPPNPQPGQTGASQSRLRSASSPDIQHPMQRSHQVPDVPVPPFPPHYAYANNSQGRSHNNLAPNQMVLPMRTATQSPGLQRDRLMHTHSIPMEQPAYYDPRYGAVSRGPVPYGQYPPPSHAADPRAYSPPNSTGNANVQQEMTTPAQLKVKVHCPSAGSSMTLVVGTNISYQSLKDRIDAKLQRSTNMSLSKGLLKLKYLDEGDYISIQSDEDVQTAFESWKESQRDQLVVGQLGEIDLYCQ